MDNKQELYNKTQDALNMLDLVSEKMGKIEKEKSKQDLLNHAKLMKKMASVIEKSGKVEKKGKNEFQHYNYATHADIIEELRKLIAEAGIFILPRPILTKKAEAMTFLEMEFEISDTETGYSVITKWFGEGMDKGDKGIYKSYTGALKYFLLDTFMISTGDDPEKESPEQPKKTPYIPQKATIPMITVDQKNRIDELLIAKDKTPEDLLVYITKAFRKTNINILTFMEANTLIKKLDAMDEPIDMDQAAKAIDSKGKNES